MHRTIASLAVALALLVGCKKPAQPVANGPTGEPGGPVDGPITTPASQPTQVIVFDAASTTDAVQAICGDFKLETNIDVTPSAAGSNELAMQILNGAPADLFLSADQRWADEVTKKGLSLESRAYLGNTLVLIVADGNPAGIHGPQDLTSDKLTHFALAGENVPAGIYAKQALTALKLYDPLESAGKIVRGKDVRATLLLVERGEAQAGVVFSTDAAKDAQTLKKVQVVSTFDPHTHDPIVYPLLLLKHAQGNAAAKQLYDYFTGAEAQDAFVKRGFTILH